VQKHFISICYHPKGNGHGMLRTLTISRDRRKGPPPIVGAASWSKLIDIKLSRHLEGENLRPMTSHIITNIMNTVA
jgi:hypothetical protein